LKEIDVANYIQGRDSDASFKGESEHEESEDDYDRKKKKKGGKKSGKAQKPKDTKKWDDAFDENGNDLEEVKQKKLRPKRQKKEVVPKNPNMLKSTNRLIGEIENKELYASDEDILDVDKEKLFGDAVFDNAQDYRA
jgi:hypothetical protein